MKKKEIARITSAGPTIERVLLLLNDDVQRISPNGGFLTQKERVELHASFKTPTEIRISNMYAAVHMRLVKDLLDMAVMGRSKHNI